MQLRIIPNSNTDDAVPSEPEPPQATNGDVPHSSTPAQALFKAISDCQELHPDPPEGSDEENDETAPGASGWITSENMQDFMDENGEFRMPEGFTVVGAEDQEEERALGEGAGRIRTAAEVEGVDGGEDDSKWQRTG